MTTYRLQSDQNVFAPNIVRFAQKLYQDGKPKTAIDIVASWGMPLEAAEQIAAGEAEITLDGETVVATLTSQIQTFGKHPEVIDRQAMERAIARQVIADILEAGYSISVNDGEEIVLRRSTDPKAILAAMFSVDEERLIAHLPDNIGSFVFFVYGNSGWDVISDYGVSLEPVLKRTFELVDKLEQES